MNRSVRVRRLEAGLTLGQLGKLAGVSGDTISRLERGERLSEVSQAKIEAALMRVERRQAGA